MFTGIVEEMGTVRQIRSVPEGMILEIAAQTVLGDLRIGDSISVSGACLTVVAHVRDGFRVEISPETLERTYLGRLRPGDRVNLERAVRLSDRLGGHLVTGHVDEVGRVAASQPRGRMLQMEITASRDLHPYLVRKGSIAVDGVSLTINEVLPSGFRVWIIPHTAAVTTLGAKRPGDPVHLEADLIGKYVERFLERAGGVTSGGRLTRAFLKEHGFGEKI